MSTGFLSEGPAFPAYFDLYLMFSSDHGYGDRILYSLCFFLLFSDLLTAFDQDFHFLRDGGIFTAYGYACLQYNSLQS